MKTRDIFYKVFDYTKEYHMINAGERLVAGISGGADSICLLFMLIRLQKEIGFSWTAVHVNHQLRGEEAERDQRFVEELCEKYGVPCRAFSEDVRGYADEQGLTLEEAGRVIRRKCFAKVLAEENADKIVLAHHKNDNAETFLMNLARGTGLNGLGGMRPVNGEFIRPLLCLMRSEIEEWLLEQKISWCTDSSNASDHYTRNRVRNHILPMLESQVNAKTVEHLQETMEQMQNLKSYVEEQVESATKRCASAAGDDKILVRKEEWEKEHVYLQSEILRNVIIQICGQTKDISQKHIGSLRELFVKQNGREIHLPYGVTAIRVYEGVLLEKRMSSEENVQKDKKDAIELKIPGETYIPWADQTIICSVYERKLDFSIEQIAETPYTKWFDYAIIRSNVQIRTRQTGDYLVINKAGDRQKLKSWFINEKIPSADRDHILLIARGNEILWIPGYRRSSSYLVGDATKDILKIQVCGGKKDGSKN